MYLQSPLLLPQETWGHKASVPSSLVITVAELQLLTLGTFRNDPKNTLTITKLTKHIFALLHIFSSSPLHPLSA
jgi:hypothetical protein